MWLKMRSRSSAVQVAEQNVGDRGEMGQNILIAAIRVGADRGPSRLIEPEAEVVAKALLDSFSPSRRSALRSSIAVSVPLRVSGWPDVPGCAPEIPALPPAPDR
jgi:hypothetical protein